MNKEITSSVRVDQWKNSSAVIKWFRNIENKPTVHLLFSKTRTFIRQFRYHYLTEQFNLERKSTIYQLMIMPSRKTLLFSDGEPWVKKDQENDFDVPMGCYDGAEVCKLVGTY